MGATLPVGDFFETWKILPQQLRSRELRVVQTTGGGGNGIQSALTSLVGRLNPNAGIRTIDVDQNETDNTNSSTIGQHIPNWVKKIIEPAKKYLGWAWNALKRFLPRSFTEAWSTLVTWGVQLITFDWNATDAALRQQIAQNNQAMITAAAGALGQAAGWGAVKLISTPIRGLFKPTALTQGRDRSLDIRTPVIDARAAFASADEEAGEEVRGSLQALLMVVKQAQARNAFLQFMLHSRANGWFGQEQITHQKPSCTITGQIQEGIKKLPQWLQQPAETFLEEFGESFLEGGFVLAQALDNAYHMSKLAMQDVRGPERTVIFKPDERNDEKKYVLQGPQEEVIQEAKRIYNDEVMLARKDIGEIVATNLEEVLRKKILERQLNIRFSTQKNPGSLVEKVAYSEITIPYVKTGLTWREVKAAADEFTRGNPYHQKTWKLYKGREYLGNVTVTGDSEVTINKRQRKLKTLVPSGVDWRAGKLETKDEDNPLFRNAPQIFYPLDCTLTVQKDSTDDLERRLKGGRRVNAYPDQKVFRDMTKIELWPEREPPGFTGFR